MTPETALRTVALANETVAGLLGARVYPNQAAQGAAYPLAVYNRVASEYFDNLEGVDDDGLASCRVQLDVFGKTHDAAREAADAIRAALNGYSGTVGTEDTLNVRRVRCVNDMDGFDSATDGSAVGACRVVLEFEVWTID